MKAPYKSAAYVFGTMVELTLFAATAAAGREAAAALLREFDRLHWKLHAWKSGDLVALNRAIAAGARRLRLDPEMAWVTRQAARFSALSRGLFNPAIGRLVALWNFHGDTFTATRPRSADIARLVHANPQMTDLVVRDDELECANSSVQLDLGGYAKGYALDLGARLLRERQVEDALINIGGHLMALGQCGDRPWSVALRDPLRAGLLARLELHDGEVLSTSGDYERFFWMDGERYGHVVDPRSGFPVRGARAASVLAAPAPCAGALSDSASGALYVAGKDAWRAAAAEMGISHALLVDDEGRVDITEALRRRVA